MSTSIRVPDHVHEQARSEAQSKGESIGDIITEWMLVARYEERDADE